MSFIAAPKIGDEPGLFSQPKLTDERGRLAALYRYEILDTNPETDFEDIVRVVKAVFGVPMVAITLIDTDRQWFKARTGLDVLQTPRSMAFCDHTIRSTGALGVEDATQDPRFAANPLVTGEPGIRCYLGVPLTTPDGYNLGSLCIIGTEPRHFTPADKEVLHEFGRLVMSKMELRMLARRDALTGALSRRAFEEHLEPWRAQLTPRLQPVLDRHHQSLVALVQSLEQAGHGPDLIRSCVRDLLASYEADLTSALAYEGVAQ